jgi:XTP/dITP diphosphohydrolase
LENFYHKNHKNMNQTLLIASTNQGKLREMEAILAPLLKKAAVRLLLPSAVGLKLEVEEDGKTYAENAAKKALAYAAASGMPALADDSGLEVDALGGQPGLHSARYAPWPGATDADRRRYLLQNLTGIARPWWARFHCTVAVAVPGLDVHLAVGNCSGEVIPEERGLGGFGYDPIFYLPDLGRTMAELPEGKKNQISHRARALHAAMPFLYELFASEES